MTRLIDLDRPGEAVDVLRSGAIVALPTDTVYGVGACLDNESAVAKLFALKQRPLSVALPVLIGSLEQLDQLDIEIDPRTQRLVDAFWPGALTLIVKANEILAQRVGSSNGTIGVRWPNDPMLRNLLTLSGPLAVTSANRHGQPPCVSADDVKREFASGSELAAIIDGGVRNAPVSTVLDVSGCDVVVVREGSVNSEQIFEIIRKA